MHKKNKILLSILFSLFASIQCINAQNINSILESNDIHPQMISYHPSGDWLISSKVNNGSKFQLIRIRDYQTKELQIDTLYFGYYQNISKLSNDGDEFLYSFLDTLQQKPERKTYLREYKNGRFGEPIDFKLETGLNALTYYMIEDNGDVYFYTYDLSPKGIYKLKKLEKGYSEPKLLIANRPNYVPFSPLLIDKNTMIMAQHGKEDKSVNGIYASRYNDGKWRLPKKLDGLPYGWSLGFGKEDNIIYLIAATRKVKEISIETLNDKIDSAFEK